MKNIECIEKNNLETLPFFFENELPLEIVQHIYICNICNEEYKNKIELTDHKLIFHDRIFDEIFTCIHCGIILSSNELLNDHIFQYHSEENDDTDDENDGNDDDYNGDIENNNNHRLEIIQSIGRRERIELQINTNITQNFECPICKKIYHNQFDLGEHFIRRHANYEDQMLLDETICIGAFPSFVILEYIGSIFIPLSTKYNTYYKNKKCNICCESFTLLKTTSNFQILKSKHLDDIYDTDINTNLNIEYEECENNEPHFPIIMTCCNGEICHDCLKKYLQKLAAKGNVQCPYCIKNHEQTECDYIKFIDIEIFNEKSWEMWWNKNNRINILTSK